MATTRRCLVDGHIFCSAMTDAAELTSQKRKRPRNICASEFDYEGWSAWGEWRRYVSWNPLCAEGWDRKNCTRDCDHPSECLHSSLERPEDESPVAPTWQIWSEEELAEDGEQGGVREDGELKPPDSAGLGIFYATPATSLEEELIKLERRQSEGHDVLAALAPLTKSFRGVGGKDHDGEDHGEENQDDENHCKHLEESPVGEDQGGRE
jgi:hypothetical protein